MSESPIYSLTLFHLMQTFSNLQLSEAKCFEENTELMFVMGSLCFPLCSSYGVKTDCLKNTFLLSSLTYPATSDMHVAVR